MTFSEKLSKLMKDNKVTAKELSITLNIGKNQFKYWADNGNTPNADTVSKLADYFCVSVDYLLGKTDIPNKKEKPAAISDELWNKIENDQKALKLLELLLNMSPEQRDKFEKFLEEI